MNNNLQLLLGNCQTTPVEELEIENNLELFPNPFRQHLNLSFTSKGIRTRVSIFDMRGAEVFIVFDRKLSSGVHSFNINLSNLAAGSYFFQLKSGGKSQGKLIVKVTT